MIERASLDPGHELHPRQRRGEEVPALLAWHDLQGLAVWRPLGDLERGELEASVSDLAQRWDWTESRVRRLLEKLEAMDEIEWQRGGGADTSRVRILRYDDTQVTRSSGSERRGTDTPAVPPTDTLKPPRQQGISRGTDTPNGTPSDTPHFYIEEEVKSGRTREEKNGGPGPVEQRVRTAWRRIQEAVDDGRLEALDLDDPVAETAFRRAGGKQVLRQARRRMHGQAEFHNTFRRAFHELAGSGGDVDDGPEEVVL